jgi:hypothetical protein
LSKKFAGISAITTRLNSGMRVLPPHIVRWIVEQFCIDIEALLRLYLIALCRDKLLYDGQKNATNVGHFKKKL